MIIRRARNRDFTVVANSVLRDGLLSFEAIGVATYLLSKPDNWEVNLSHLAKVGDIGREKMQRIVRELVEAKLLSRERHRDPETKAFTGIEYVMRDEPVEGEPQSENPTVVNVPQPEKPQPGKPQSENPTEVVSTDSEQILISTNERESAGARGGEEIDEFGLTAAERKALHKRLWAVANRYPGILHDKIEKAEPPWYRMPEDKRQRAESRLDAFVAELNWPKSGRRRPPLHEYLGEDKFDLVEAAGEGSGAGSKRKSNDRAGAFDQSWWYLFFDYIARHMAALSDARSPEATMLRQRVSGARQYAIGWPLDGIDADDVAKRSSTMHGVPKDGREAEAWSHRLGVIGVTLPIPDKAGWIYVPEGEAQDWCTGAPLLTADEVEGSMG